MKNAHRSRSQLGSVMVESAIALPVLFFLAFAVLDLGRWLDKRYYYQRVVYETARYGGSLSAISNSNNILKAAGANKRSYDDATAQGQMLKRMLLLMDSYGLPLTDTGTLDILYSEDGAFTTTSGASTGASRSVKVKLSVPFEPLFPALSGIFKMSVSADSPYLYPRS